MFRTLGFIALFALAAFGFVFRWGTAQTPAPAGTAWGISGALSETCTCKVPCTCNFGQGPSPHSYCYAFYSYHIRQGSYGSVKLDGLHFGAVDLAKGRTFFIDQAANAEQREALKVIIARVIEKATVAKTSETIRDFASALRYAEVKQEYDNRHNHLTVPGLGEFAADYLMGLDKSKPVVVRNNTTWRLPEVIKAKTTVYRVRVGKDTIDTRDTNSNQGDFNYTDQTDFGAPAAWSCGAGGAKMSHADSSDPLCRARG